jgi:hydrogenase expression/formation protein HypE
MKGARPLALSLAAIIEEGVSIKLLERITDSAMRAAKEAGVRIVTGDTKVVERGKADKMFLTSSGVGIIPKGIKLSAPNARHGDAVIINGTIGDHGIAVMAARNDFKFTTKISSDCAPLNHLAAAMLKRSPSIHVMRDPTRGGVATTLVEIATASNTGIIIDEASLPVRPQVRAACSILGLDPLYVANEGKLLAVLPEKHAATVLKTMKNDPYGKASAVIGKVVKSPKGVWLKTTAGGLRPIAMLEGAQLPRIC